MNNKIFIITDYKGLFGSKWNSSPYRSGLKIHLLINKLKKYGYEVCALNFSEAANNDNIQKDDYAIYTSTEDNNYKYKDFIEDVIFFLEKKDVKVIPRYDYLKATNNKVSMELLRKIIFPQYEHLEANVYGALEECEFKNLDNPLVFKKPKGAMSRGVFLSRNENESRKIVANISRTKNFKEELKDYLRAYKHKNYTRDSIYRNKFISQSFIENLTNDYKVLVYGSKYFIFSRPVRENDFRASGSGYQNYLFGSKCIIPDGIFEYSESIFNKKLGLTTFTKK